MPFSNLPRTLAAALKQGPTINSYADFVFPICAHWLELRRGAAFDHIKFPRAPQRRVDCGFIPPPALARRLNLQVCQMFKPLCQADARSIG